MPGASADEIQRSLGRIEGVQSQILSEIRAIQERFGMHVNDDQVALSDLRTKLAASRQELADQFQLQRDERNARIDTIDQKLDEIFGYVRYAKGAGWVLLGAVGLGASFIVNHVLPMFHLGGKT